MVFDGGPWDTKRMNVETRDGLHPPPQYMVGSVEHGRLDGADLTPRRHVYVFEQVVRPWQDQTWSWVYRYSGEW